MRALLTLLLTLAVWAAPPADPIHITPAECQTHGLKPLEIRLEPAGTNMLTRRFPEKDVYLALSGPPGGPLSFQLLPCRAQNAAELRPFLEKRMSSYKPQFGPASEIELAGAARASLGLITGESLARTRWCAVLLHDRGCLALFGVSAGQDPPDNGHSVLKHKNLAPLVRTLKVNAP